MTFFPVFIIDTILSADTCCVHKLTLPLASLMLSNLVYYHNNYKPVTRLRDPQLGLKPDTVYIPKHKQENWTSVFSLDFK